MDDWEWNGLAIGGVLMSAILTQGSKLRTQFGRRDPLPLSFRMVKTKRRRSKIRLVVKSGKGGLVLVNDCGDEGVVPWFECSNILSGLNESQRGNPAFDRSNITEPSKYTHVS
ncbi:hypothetical protein B0H16DRAFT_1457253 [Mycena metata]|uniref:Uncharacterized protein n=1 Tax=Mycena metata TaxID=1033252 RepID=A0AAD7J7C8_9AGAR|nr:hypothetical protein B0H16DRAFT_1457253 [Mycena metata]